MSRPGIRANEESSTLQKARPSKSGEEKGEMCKGGMGEGGEDLSRGEDLGRGEDLNRGDGEGRRASVQKLSLTRRQSRDLLKKKTSVEEQVPLVQYTWPGEERLVFSCGENGLCPPCRRAHPL